MRTCLSLGVLFSLRSGSFIRELNGEYSSLLLCQNKVFTVPSWKQMPVVVGDIAPWWKNYLAMLKVLGFNL